MADDVGAGAAPVRRRRQYVRWSKAVADRLLARLAAGELLYRIARDPDMPTPKAVAKWAREKPEFAEALLKARREGGRPAGTKGQPFGLCEHVAHEILERMCEGQSLTSIGRDPTMPSVSTIFSWRRKFPNPDTGQVEREDEPGWRQGAALGVAAGWTLGRAGVSALRRSWNPRPPQAPY